MRARPDRAQAGKPQLDGPERKRPLAGRFPREPALEREKPHRRLGEAFPMPDQAKHRPEFTDAPKAELDWLMALDMASRLWPLSPPLRNALFDI